VHARLVKTTVLSTETAKNAKVHERRRILATVVYRNLSMTRVFLYAGSLRIAGRSAMSFKTCLRVGATAFLLLALSTTIAVAQ
jgi:hypothetical protein